MSRKTQHTRFEDKILRKLANEDKPQVVTACLYIQDDFLLESSVFVFVFVFACVFVIVITGASLDSTRREHSEYVLNVGL